MGKIPLHHKTDYIDAAGRKIRRLKCITPTCLNYVSDRGDCKISGKCRQCSKKKKPFLTTWKRLFHDWRELSVEITYEQFLNFTETKECHYCGKTIPWKPHSSETNKNCAYYLDRKDNSLGYSVSNCVVCCTRCNRMRSDKFSYSEFLSLSPALRLIERQRNERVSDL